MHSTSTTPVSISERADILDILRGVALLGICLANYPVFSLYVFQTKETLTGMPTASIDKWVSYFHFIFIDGKFYSLFSLLFGIGFSIILLRSRAKGLGLNIFYRRLFILILLGLAHSLLLWQGDILLLYGLIGLILPLFRNVSSRNLIIFWVVLILLPIVIDAIKVLTDNQWNMSKPLGRMALAIEGPMGITDANWRTWLLDQTSYVDLLKYNQSGIFWRYQGLLDNNRFFKVLGMFILGLYVGKNLIYRKLEENKSLLKKVRFWGFIIGLPISILYAFLEMDEHRLPEAFALLDTIAYAFSVVPLSLAYTASISLWFLNAKYREFLKLFSNPGRMALTNYILQSVLGILIFYGVGFGFGAKTGLIYVILIAIGIYGLEIIFSHFWLKYFNYGPLEWLWRQLTFGKRFPLRKQASSN